MNGKSKDGNNKIDNSNKDAKNNQLPETIKLHRINITPLCDALKVQDIEAQKDGNKPQGT